MSAERPRFSILQLFELIAVLAVALALGRIIPPYVGPSMTPTPRLVLVLLGSALGAYLGLRWFGRGKTIDCAMKTIPLSIVATAVMLLPIIAKLWTEATLDHLRIYPATERWRGFGFMSLAAGIIGPILVLCFAPIWNALRTRPTRKISQ